MIVLSCFLYNYTIDREHFLIFIFFSPLHAVQYIGQSLFCVIHVYMICHCRQPVDIFNIINCFFAHKMYIKNLIKCNLFFFLFCSCFFLHFKKKQELLAEPFFCQSKPTNVLLLLLLLRLCCCCT